MTKILVLLVALSLFPVQTFAIQGGQMKTVAVGTVPAHTSVTVSFQWAVAFEDNKYATGISLASNAGDQTHPASDNGLKVESFVRRPDGMDVTLYNPHDTDQASDTMTVWAGK